MPKGKALCASGAVASSKKPERFDLPRRPEAELPLNPSALCSALLKAAG